MTFAICGYIEFPSSRGRQKIVIRRFSSVKIETSWQLLTGTAEIVLPRRVADFDREKVNEVFRQGDPVIIRLGYDGELFTEFDGYVLKVSTGAPVVITCENEMYKLKRNTVSISKPKCSLKELLNTIAPGYTVECDDTPIGSVRYSEKSVTEIFDDLKSKMGLYAYFRGKTLVCGRTTKETGETVRVTIEKQAADNLKERSVEDVLVKVESIQKNGKMLKFETGEKPGNTITIKQPYLAKGEIERIGNDMYKKAKEPGLDGDITLFGVPRVEHGDKVELRSILYSEKDGTYYVDGVTKSVESGQGYRQNVKLGTKAK